MTVTTMKIFHGHPMSQWTREHRLRKYKYDHPSFPFSFK